MADSIEHELPSVKTEQWTISSEYLERDVLIDVYIPRKFNTTAEMGLLLINDGQDLVKMPFDELLDNLISKDEIEPLVCIGIHCGQTANGESRGGYEARQGANADGD